MMKPKFLWNNVLRGITPTWSGTTVSGKGPANATDFFDWSYFEADAGDLDYTMTSNTDIDAASIYTATNTSTTTITLKYESGVSSFTTLKTWTATSGKLTLDEFSGVTVSSGRRIRLSFSGGDINVRQLVVGEVMESEQGQFATMTWPKLTGGVKTSNVVSLNGSIIGRSIKRLERRGQLDLEYISATWYRSTFEPFAQHASRYPFIYAPDLDGRSDEVAFAAVEGGIQSPENMGGFGDRMSVQMRLHMLAADEFAI
jgi:hypothetical protein